ncbi:MAG: tyrosinase family protein [Chloroflexota bacterium]|nr:tyrosinase family protein [Chloroflexota bacterium]
MTVHCRKNQADLSDTERNRFIAAILAIKANGTYDAIVAEHMGVMFNAHRGPAFFPWHREYLRRFELALQGIDPQVTLPYWDWSVDNSALSSIWDPSFLGGNGRPSDGVVTTGAFAHNTGDWTLIYDGPALRRRFGVSAPTLPTPTDVSAALSDPVYDVAPWSQTSTSGFRNRLEGWISGPQLHNRVHVWVGGSMGPMSSPNDPVFFLHHCFIDKLWADWQQMHPGSGYLPVAGGPGGHNLNDAMEPWLSQGDTVTILSVLDHHALGYAYNTEGVCQSTIKFRDDSPTTLKFRDDPATLKFSDDSPPTLKFRDDVPTLKFADDPPPTLKFRDDLPPTLKFRDDPPGTLKFSDDSPPTLKFRDDPATLKFADDSPPTLKFRDDPATLKFSDDSPQTLKFRDDPATLKFSDDGGNEVSVTKAVDDVKLPALDDPAFFKARQDTVNPLSDIGRPAPFVLSTPHHSMAWAQEQPGVLQAVVAQLESELMQLSSVISNHEQARQHGLLTPDESATLQQCCEDYEAVLDEYHRLLGGETS